MEKEILLLNTLLTPAVANAITEYTSWYVTSSILWIVCGVMLVAAGLYARRKQEEWEEAAVIVCVVCVFFGCCVIIGSIPDLLHPKAKAIHQLLRDASGSH